MNHEQVARENNSPDKWARIWDREGSTSWRGVAMAEVYARIVTLAAQCRDPYHQAVDLGGGIGLLAEQMPLPTRVVEHSLEVVTAAQARGVEASLWDLEADPILFQPGQLVVSTEVFEHLSEAARTRILDSAERVGCYMLISVPNDRLGPDEEPQHSIKWTALEFLTYLRRWYPNARVEVMGGYLLGICGFPRPYSLSFTMPVRDEAADIERTLASFRGVADQIVIGVDPRTTDRTREIARKYAEVVFDLEDPQGPPEERRPDKGVHFAWIRNQCIQKCTGDWIMMSEGHEHLEEGQDVLLNLHTLVPKAAKVGFVLRRLGTQQWGFPWLFRKDPTIKFIRHTHNSLDYPEGTYCVKLPQVVTRHDRVHDREKARAEQRKTQNRRGLMDDWVTRGNANSLYYLGAEWRGFDQNKSREYFEEFLRTSHNGGQRYQARLELAVSYAKDGMLKEAREHLHAATADDWSRIEHFLWLGDMAFEEGQMEQAYRMYRLASTGIGQPPFVLWWIELSFYSYVPAQRLAMVSCELDRYDEALRWARRVVELLPEDAPEDLRQECTENVKKLEEALNVAA
jgi:tetratricopeptide (TPR) repeat protein